MKVSPFAEPQLGGIGGMTTGGVGAGVPGKGLRLVEPVEFGEDVGELTLTLQAVTQLSRINSV